MFPIRRIRRKTEIAVIKVARILVNNQGRWGNTDFNRPRRTHKILREPTPYHISERDKCKADKILDPLPEQGQLKEVPQDASSTYLDPNLITHDSEHRNQYSDTSLKLDATLENDDQYSDTVTEW
jgi:hypothetical protein